MLSRRARRVAFVVAGGVAGAAGVMVLGAPATAHAQGAPTARGVHGAAPGEARMVQGRVVRAGAAAARPLAGAWVVLHRVGSDRAAPLDSMRTDAAGGYRFRYRTSGDPRAVYFVSSAHGGIAYFTSPLQAARVTGDEAELVVHDTTSAPVPIRIRARHLVIAAPDSAGERAIVEIFELSNDSSVTRVAVGDTGVVWQSVVMEEARRPSVGRTDFSEGAVRFEDGRVRLSAPFAPGLKQFSFTYQVPEETDYAVRLAAPAEVLEVLIEDPLGRAEGGGLVSAGPTTLNGRTFARFLAQDAPDGAVLRISAPTEGSGSGPNLRVLAILTALGAVLLVGLARAMMRRSPPARGAAGGDAETLRRRLAGLEASFAQIEQPTADQRADHWQARARLHQEIADAVAREQGLS